MIHRTYHSGFTLIEVVLAISLLTLLSTAAISWAIAQRRAGIVITERMERFTQALACVRAIEDDLQVISGNAATVQPMTNGHLRFTTLHSFYDEVAGVRTVTWQFQVPAANNKTGALIRHQQIGDQATERIAMLGLLSANIQRDPDKGLMLVITWARPHDAQDDAGDVITWSFPLRTSDL